MTSLARILIVIALFATLPRASAAQPAGDGGAGLEALADDLRLTAAQRERVRDVADAGRKEQIALRAEMEVVEIDLRRELEKDSPDEARVGTLAVKLGSLEGTARRSRIVTWLRLRKILSAEQRRLLERLHASGGRAQPRPRPRDSSCDEVTCLVAPEQACCKSARISITSTSPARIVLDGKAAGRTPIELSVTPGRHTVSAEREGGRTHRRVVDVAPGATVKMALDMSDDARDGGEVPERVDRAAISTGIGSVKADVRACGTQHQVTDAVVTAKITIGVAGTVTSVEPKGGPPELRACMKRALEKARFPRSRLGITVTYPFVF